MFDLQTSNNNGPVEALYERLTAYEKARRKAKRKGKLSVAGASMLVMYTSILLALVCSALSLKVVPAAVAYYVFLIFSEFFLLVAFISALIFPAAGYIEIAPFQPKTWNNIKDPFPNIMKGNSRLDEQDFRFTAEIRDAYDPEALNFLAKRLPLRASHVRDRYGIVIGSPSQLKVLVILGTAVQLTLTGYFRPFIQRMGYFVPAVFIFTFVLLFVLALVDQPITQRMEELAQLLELAADQERVMKEQLDSAASKGV